MHAWASLYGRQAVAYIEVSPVYVTNVIQRIGKGQYSLASVLVKELREMRLKIMPDCLRDSSSKFLLRVYSQSTFPLVNMTERQCMFEISFLSLIWTLFLGWQVSSTPKSFTSIMINPEFGRNGSKCWSRYVMLINHYSTG